MRYGLSRAARQPRSTEVSASHPVYFEVRVNRSELSVWAVIVATPCSFHLEGHLSKTHVRDNIFRVKHWLRLGGKMLFLLEVISFVWTTSGYYFYTKNC